MERIPVIAGFGGVNAAGRSSGHHGYRRTIADAIEAPRADAMWRSLAGLVGHDGPLDAAAVERLADRTLVRTLEPEALRALQLTVYGASDALGSLGIDWSEVIAAG